MFAPEIAVAQPLDPRNPPFYAKCDGTTDDSTALQAWANAFTSNSTAIVPGVCAYETPITFPIGINYVDLSGGKLLYTGGSTTITGLKIGAIDQSACQNTGWNIHDLFVSSQTIMTAGSGLLVANACHFNFTNIRVGDQFGAGNTNWLIGLHVYGGNSIFVRGSFFTASRVAVLINGNSGVLPQLTDPFFDQVVIVNSALGLDIGGNVGGFSCNECDIVNNGANVRITQDTIALPNGQVFFGPGSAIDATDTVHYPSETGIGLEIKDAGKPSGDSEFIFNGTWLASATNQCFLIDSGAQWTVHLTGGTVENCHPSSASHGSIENQSLTAKIFISGVRFRTPGVYGPDLFNVASAVPFNLQADLFEDTPFGSWGHIVGTWTSAMGL